MEELEQTADVRNDDEVAGQVDPFNHPIPGESLTAEPGNNQYESAPEETDPDLFRYYLNKDIKAHANKDDGI